MFSWFKKDVKHLKGSKLINYVLKQIRKGEFNLDPYKRNITSKNIPDSVKIEQWIHNLQLMNNENKNTPCTFKGVKMRSHKEVTIGEFFTNKDTLMFDNYLEPLEILLIEGLELTEWWEATKDRFTTTGSNFVNNRKVEPYIISLEHWLKVLIELEKEGGKK